MLLSIMVGVILITFFIADIVHKSEMQELETGYKEEISTIEFKNINFTNNFLKSSVILDQAREDRAFGNYHFDLAFLWYQSALSENNASTLYDYKYWGIDNCTYALPYYTYSSENFLESKIYFQETMNCTEYPKYLEILSLYISLTDAGSNLTILRYNATLYLMYLLENLTYQNGGAAFLTNVTALMDLFDQTMQEYEKQKDIYDELQDDIDGYEFFEELR